MSKGRAKNRKKASRKRGRAGKVFRKIRISKDQVMHVHRLANGGDPEAAMKALRAFHPQLNERDIAELMTRVTDPQALGGIETGFDPVIGEFADFTLLG
jgi:hypothetical protein